jgi:plasmid stabilization system protein ParE
LLNEIGYLELELRAAGPGRRFFGEVQRAENLISQFPELAPEISAGVRKRLLRKFGYSLIYTIEKDRVLILAVAHYRRRPGYWIGRVRQTDKEDEDPA